MHSALNVTDIHAIPMEEISQRNGGASVRAWLATTSGRIALASLILFVAYGVWLLSGWNPARRSLIADTWNASIAGLTALAAWSAASFRSLEPRLRRAWGFNALAAACGFVGNAWWLISQNFLGHKPPVVSFVDVFYLAVYPLLFAALITFPNEKRTRADRLQISLDAATVVVAGGAAVWQFVIGPALRDPSITSFETILTFTYPVADLVLLFGCAFALQHRPGPVARIPVLLLAVGGMTMFVTDLTYGHIVLHDGNYATGHPVELGWSLAFILGIVAAMYQRFAAERVSTVLVPATQHRGVTLLPYASVLAGFGFLLTVVIPARSLPLMIGAATVALLFLTVIIRQVLAVREIGRLVRERSAREARFRNMVQQSSDVISILDRENVLQFLSPAVGRVLRWNPETLVGRDITTLIHPDDVAAACAFLHSLAQRPGETASFICRLLDGDGKWRHMETTCSSLLTDPSVAGLVLNSRDVSDRTRLEAELTRRAYNDPLTGLANRVRFQELTEQALRRALRRPSHCAVIYLDIDSFKAINDRLGHLQGDQLLVDFTARLLNATRGFDTVARLGGDEFAVLLEGMLSEANALPVAERITTAMRKPFYLGNAEVVVSASIGIAHAVPGSSAEDVMRDADVAMYEAKRSGKGQLQVFSPSMLEAARSHHELESDLRAALERDELYLVYQPVINLHSGQITGAEALLRWRHPAKGELTPGAFIKVAVDSGLIVPIGWRVLQRACEELATWRRLYPAAQHLTMAVNVAGRQFQSESFVNDVAAVVSETGIPADRLVIEITEGEIMRETEATLTRLHGLKALGVQIAIDDFGTGYSSLSYLQQFPVDVLKIDKSFIDPVAHVGHSQSLARMIVGLGETLGMRTIGEGIEHSEQACVLRDMGCEEAQGYYYAAPLPSDELVRRVLVQAGVTATLDS